MGGSSGVEVKEKKKRRRDSDKAGESRKKKSKSSTEEEGGVEVGKDVAVYVSPLAKPMAGRKLQKRLFKLMGRAAKVKALRRGIKEVQLALRKDEKGICIIAGDVYPVDVAAHIPLLCEEAEVPYCYVARKAELGAAGLTKRPTSVALVSRKAAGEELSGDIADLATQVQEIYPEVFS